MVQTLTRTGRGVFADNRKRPIHRWFPFVEGYSAQLVTNALQEADPASLQIVDPFGGSGTTALAAAFQGYASSFAEVNPYLAWVAETKVNATRQVYDEPSELARLRGLRPKGRGAFPRRLDHPLVEVDAKRGFFPDGVAAGVVAMLVRIDEGLEGAARDLARLAVATALIPTSNMVRRTDLRRRVMSDPAPADLEEQVWRNLEAIASDVSEAGHLVTASCQRLADDARELPTDRGWTLVVTSPPYLNGTNYCRNTKLELLALGFIESEADLRDIRSRAISAGINNVSSRRDSPEEIPEVEVVASALDLVTYDVRIPAMVRGYFSDMRAAIRCLRRGAQTGCRFVLDIGDSRFAGVHIPTDQLLVGIAEREGWTLRTREQLRARRSYDGATLTQVLLEFEAV